jgi:nitrate/TMAO reductase-like tetraheme cytochrome c subunit
MGKSGKWLWAIAVCVLVAGSAAAAFQDDLKKDADLPPEIAKLPFEIRDGYRRFMKRCTTCHDTKRIDEAKKTLFQWSGTVGTMAFKQGANIPVEDRHSIFLYLTYLHGTKGTPQEKEQYLTFLAKCEDCHGISLMYKDKKPMKDWPSIVHRMAGKNQASITPDEEKKVMGYISRMSPDLFGVD